MAGRNWFPSEISVMFAATRFFLPPVHCRTRAAIPSSRTPALVAVSARPRRRGARRDRSWSDDEDGADDRIDDSFFGDARDEEPEPEPAEEEAATRQRPSSPTPEPAGQLRGSDVLRALQRAAAAKEAKKKKKAGARPQPRRQFPDTKRPGKLATAAGAGEVRPIEIRREWAPRIRELELRVQQLLVHKNHHSPSRTPS
ncbi:hypothetical protein GUJ93_ZPchr0012g21452 [Zizania palustris]|uniref:Uncharacterized protein n=1 Tax=Zizania palustris TaxID=103762 RepID=A0A8J6BUP4_ZIZPA|nr:hypothetical protein GUJ93_ZPchr0012g21452 [Zizania palustris]